jgi:hypothetical protein
MLREVGGTASVANDKRPATTPATAACMPAGWLGADGTFLLADCQLINNSIRTPPGYVAPLHIREHNVSVRKLCKWSGGTD